MNKRLRSVTFVLVFLYGFNHWALGLSWLTTYRNSITAVLAFAFYALALVLGTASRGSHLPAWRAYLLFLICVAIPKLIIVGLPVSDLLPNGSYQTWFVGGVSTLLAILMARGWPVLSWIGLGLLWAQVILWAGPPIIFTVGLVGAALIVAASYAVGVALNNTRRMTAESVRQSTEIATRTAQVMARRLERQRTTQSTLLTAQPLLEVIVETGGRLSQPAKVEALLMEARLRDEIQGRALLNDGVRVAVREARKRGVEVTLLDQDGLDKTPADVLEDIHQSIIHAIRSTNSGKITIKAPRGESYLVSIIATRPEASSPDLWLRLP